MMTPQEFARRRDKLRSLLVLARCYYAISLELWPTDERVDILNRFLDFFVPARQAILDEALLSYAKAYDPDGRTASIRVLLKAAKANPGLLIPNAKPGEIATLEALVDQNAATLATLKHVREQRLAHQDANPSGDMKLPKGMLDRLVKDTEEAFNELSRMHDRASTLFMIQVSDTERHTRQVIKTLQEAEAARRLRSESGLRIWDVLLALERNQGVSLYGQAPFRNVMDKLDVDDLHSWIQLRDDLRTINQEGLSAEVTRAIAEIRDLVDRGLGM